MWFESKWMQLEDIMLREVSQAQKDKVHIVFSHTRKKDSKYKHIHKNKHAHIQTHMYSKFVIVELLYGTWGKRERKRE
jgi:thiamine phosphate synthase YjbQ (UPF0047 family)